MTKRFWKCAAVALCMIAMLLVGCGQSNVPTESQAMQTITDCVGRQVEIPQNPQRIAALDSFAGEAVVMAGGGEKLVTVPNGVRMDVLLRELYPGLENVDVTMSGGAVNAEALLSLQPDLALVKAGLYANEAEMAKLDKLGIPYLVVEYTDMEGQLFAMDMIGQVLGGNEEARMNQMSEYYREIIRQAKEISATIPEDKRVRVYHAIHEAVRTDGNASLGQDWINTVGAVNVSCMTEESGQGDYTASVEQIYAWDPDVIICNEADTAEYLRQNDKWQGLRAVREGRVYNIPVGATRWGQRGSLETFFAMLWLETTLYPEYYSCNLKQEVVDFYQNVLDYTLDDATYEQMLTGRGLRTVHGLNQ